MYCIICNRSIDIEAKALVNGSMYHPDCYESLLNKLKTFERDLSAVKAEKITILRTLNPPNTLLSRITALLKNPLKKQHKEIDIEECTQILKRIENIEHSLDQKIRDNKSKLNHLYTFWPTYPPDWEERRQIKLSQQSFCEECGRDRSLHVHHILRIGNGGSHKQSNLQVLCEKCHRKEHGGKKFSYRKNISSSNHIGSEESAFSKRLQKINEAISQKTYIKFNYKKFNGEKSTRTIKPTHLQKRGKSICIHGWCYLRDAERIFSIKRMRWIRVVSAPQKRHPALRKKRSASKKQRKQTTSSKIKNTSIKLSPPKTQIEDVYEQLEQHDLENLKMMGYDTDDD